MYKLKPITFFLLFIPLLVYAVEWHEITYGKWIVTHFQNNPFPFKDDIDPALKDSTVFIFVPQGYIAKEYTDLIIDHHGHGSIVDPANVIKPSYPEKFRQAYQLFESRKNAILVMPQAAYNKASSAAGKFENHGAFEKFVSELMQFLQDEDIIPDNSTLRQIHISSFSGGYNITAYDISNNPADFISHIKSVNLWDSFYGREEEFLDWVIIKKLPFYSFYTPSGGTGSLNLMLCDSLEKLQIPFDSLFFGSENTQQIMIQYTHRAHSDVSVGEFNYAQYLVRLPLDDIDIRAPLLLFAVPDENGISIFWARQHNPFLAGYRLWASRDGSDWELLSDENQLSPQTLNYHHNTGTRNIYKIESVSRSQKIRSAPFWLAASPATETAKILLVHAENRRLKEVVRGFEPDSFLYQINQDLIEIVARSINMPYASCTNYAIREGLIDPSMFTHVIWLAGNENIRAKLIDHAEQQWLKMFLDLGGNLLISGANTTSDLASVNTSYEDRRFGELICGVSGTDTAKTAVSIIRTLKPFPEKEFNISGLPRPEIAFRYTLIPLIILDVQYPLATIRKFLSAEGETATILTLGFSLALQASDDLADFIIANFIDYSYNGPLTPQPPVLGEQIYLTTEGIQTNWPEETGQFLINSYSGRRELLSVDTVDSPPLTVIFPADSVCFNRLQVRSGNLISRPSEMLGVSQFKNTRGRVLIVNGFDRVTAYNTFDYIIEHGQAFNELDYNFDSATNEAVVAGVVTLSDYKLVDWILGEESTVDHTFSPEEQRIIADYLTQGGKMLISGAEIGWDLVDKASQPADSIFFRDVLKAVYLNDNAESSCFFLVNSDTTQYDSIHFGGIYPVAYPDIIAPTAGADLLLKYDTGQGAAVGAGHQYDGKSALVAFPLETIDRRDKRIQVFRYLIDYLLGE